MIRPGKLFWKLFLGNILLTAAVLSISFWVIYAQGWDAEFRISHTLSNSMLWTLAAVTLVVVVALAVGLTFIWTRPIQRITAAARGISDGDLSARVAVGGRDELALLAQALNRMRNHQAMQLQTIDRQRRTLQSLMAQLHEGVVVAGPDGRVVLVNPTALRLLGIPDGDPRSFEGRAIEEFVSPYDLQRMLLQAQRTPDESGVQEFRLQIKIEDGEISVLARASDIVLPSFAESVVGETTVQPKVGRLLALMDVTALDRAIQIKADFAANASHELRTPLATIRAAVETAMQTELPSEARQFLQLIDRHSKRMEEMVADLLNLSRIESSPTQFQPTRVHVRELLGDAQRRHVEKMENKGLHWSLEIPAGLSHMVVNPHLIHLVLDNLLDNSIKFTEKGGQIRLICWEESSGDRKLFHLQVADTGCGIPEEDQTRVFERFYQVERARSGPDRGTGLGLSIVRHAVAAMQGAVELKSKLGKGTLVTITIPQGAD